MSMQLVELCYKVTGSFPKSEQFGASGQIRRAALSIPANIAEGHCRRTTGAYLNHVSIALGSHGELCTLLEVSSRLRFLSESQTADLRRITDSVGRLLYGLYNALERRQSQAHGPTSGP